MEEQETKAAKKLKHLPAASPAYVEPMKARLESELPLGDGWLFEVKLDGIRAIAVKDGARVRLFSRRPRDLTSDYPKLVAAVAGLPVQSAVLDGEIAALDEHGRSSFQVLQNSRRAGAGAPAVFFFIFDLLQLDGRDVRTLPLVQRRALLESLLPRPRGPLRLSPVLPGKPAVIWKEVQKLGLEGVIAKRSESPYESGRRSGAWLKIKTQNEQEFVIGGYTAPDGSRQYFGSILVGVYEGGALVFASRVGTGFNFATLASLHRRFQELRTPVCPFANLPSRRQGKFGQGVTAADMKRCTWLKPRLVCQVRFLEWTSDDSLRQPVFVGLRDDKKPEEVVREKPAPR